MAFEQLSWLGSNIVPSSRGKRRKREKREREGERILDLFCLKFYGRRRERERKKHICTKLDMELVMSV